VTSGGFSAGGEGLAPAEDQGNATARLPRQGSRRCLPWARYFL